MICKGKRSNCSIYTYSFSFSLRKKKKSRSCALHFARRKRGEIEKALIAFWSEKFACILFLLYCMYVPFCFSQNTVFLFKRVSCLFCLSCFLRKQNKEYTEQCTCIQRHTILSTEAYYTILYYLYSTIYIVLGVYSTIYIILSILYWMCFSNATWKHTLSLSCNKKGGIEQLSKQGEQETCNRIIENKNGTVTGGV